MKLDLSVIKPLYDARTQKALADPVWAMRPPQFLHASSLKVGDAIYAESDGGEFLILRICPAGKDLEFSVGSDFTSFQPSPFRLAPDTLVMASQLN